MTFFHIATTMEQKQFHPQMPVRVKITIVTIIGNCTHADCRKRNCAVDDSIGASYNPQN